MSSFKCEKCNEVCHDTPRGYVTGCKHYPPDVAAVNHMYKRYLETRKVLEDLLPIQFLFSDELISKIKELLND